MKVVLTRIVVPLAAALFAAGASAAAPAAPAAGATANTDANSAAMTNDEVKQKIEAAGYTDVSHIRKEKDHFDARAKKDGKTVRLDVDPKTGDVSEETRMHEAKERHAKKT